MKKILVVILCLASIVVKSQNKIVWNTGTNISTNSFGNMHPRLTIDRAGNPLVIWGRMSDQALLFSRWNGTGFTTPVKLNPNWLTVATAGWMGPDIASKGDTVYIVMKRTPEASDTNHIYIMASFNGGVSFLSPVRVDYIADSISRFPTVDVDASGNPIVAFMKFNSSFLDSRWVVVKSNDYGKTFTTDVKASGYSGAKAEVCDCCPGAIISSGNTTAMLYRDNLSNLRDIWTGISKNNSTSFPTGFATDNTKWMINSCPASGPDGVIVGDTLYSVFLSGGKGTYRTYLSTLSIKDGKLNTVKNLTGALTGLGQQNYPRIAANGKAMAIVWKQTVSAVAQLPILFTNNISKGFPANYDTVDLTDITNADVALSTGNVFVVWQDDKSGTVKFRSGSYTPFNAGRMSEIKNETFNIFPNPASTAITIQSGFNLNNSQIKIVNSIGEIVLFQTIVNSVNTSIDIGKLINGVYIIQVKTSHNILIQRFIKH